jgi:uncharacterized cupredoxin-like copper-binding protein
MTNKPTVLATLASLVLLAGCGSSGYGSSGSGNSSSSGSSTPSTKASGGSGYGGYAAAGQTTKAAAAPTGSAGAGTATVAADPSGALAFTTKTLHAKAGKVTLVMSNPPGSGVPHGIAVEGNGVDKVGKVVPAGGTSTLRVALKPGSYTFYCPVPGHKAAGMKGTLTVQ